MMPLEFSTHLPFIDRQRASSLTAAFCLLSTITACGNDRESQDQNDAQPLLVNVDPNNPNNPNQPVLDQDIGSLDVGDPDAKIVDDGCEKLDILFVIDNSTSMEPAQTNLRDNIPTWIDVIKQELGPSVSDYHIGVVTTDENLECGGLGGLAVTTWTGTCHANASCLPFATPDARYLTEADDLETSFECIATPGACGSNIEEPAMAAVRAVSPELNAEGACNEGFSRRDALLVIVMLTDEPDDSIGTPKEWFDQIVEAKGGVESNVVMISIITDEFPPSEAHPDYVPGCWVTGGINQLDVELTNMFTHGYLYNVCLLDYGESLGEAAVAIDGACDSFTPVPVL